MLELLKKEVEENKNPAQAEHSQRFFKTGKGEYGEGDKFLGLTTPVLKGIAKKYRNLEIGDIQKLLNSEYHDMRVIALTILTDL